MRILEYKLSDSEDGQMADTAKQLYIQASLSQPGWAMQGRLCTHVSLDLGQLKGAFNIVS